MAKGKRVLTAAEEATIRRELARGSTDAEAGRAAGVSDRKLYRAREYELADLPRNKRGPRPGRVYPPPPEFVDLPVEEIYRRAAELRAAWSDERRAEAWSPHWRQPGEILPDGPPVV